MVQLELPSNQLIAHSFDQTRLEMAKPWDFQCQDSEIKLKLECNAELGQLKPMASRPQWPSNDFDCFCLVTVSHRVEVRWEEKSRGIRWARLNGWTLQQTFKAACKLYNTKGLKSVHRGLLVGKSALIFICDFSVCTSTWKRPQQFQF